MLGALRATLVLLALLAVLVAAAAWRLSRDPIPLPFLVPRVEAGIEAAEAPVVARIEQMLLVWDQHGPELRALGVTISNREGLLLVQLPELSVQLSLAALLRGQIAVHGVDLEGPVFKVERAEDGSVDVGLAGDPEQRDSEDQALRELLKVLTEYPGDRDTRLSLKRLRVRDARILVDDRGPGGAWSVSDANIALYRRGAGLAVRADGRVEIDGSQGRVEASARWRSGEENLELELDVRDLDLPTLVAVATGAARAPLPPLPLRAEVTAQLPLEDPARVEALRFALETPLLRASGRSQWRDDERLLLASEFSLRDLQVSELGTWWLAGIADAAREWILENIRDGSVENLKGELGLVLDPEAGGFSLDSLSGTFDVVDTRIHYLDPLPPASGVRAAARFGPDTIDFEISRARIDEVAIDGCEVGITGLSAEDQFMRIDGRVVGELPTILGILDMPPLELIDAVTGDPQDFRGQVDGNAQLYFLMARDMDPSDIEVLIEAEVHEVSAGGLPFELVLEGGELHLDATHEMLSLSGTTRMSGVPGRLSLRDTFRDERGLRRVEITAQLDAWEGSEKPFEVRIDASREGERVREALMRLDFDSGVASWIRYADDPEARLLEMHSDDLGSSLCAIGVEERLRGGVLALDGRSAEPGGPIAGRFELSDFTLAETPAVARVLDALSLKNIRRTLQRDGITWQEFSGRFLLDDDQLELAEASAVSRSLAITADRAQIGLEGGSLEAEGSVVPWSWESSVVRSIPLLGPLVTGSDEVLVAAHYRMSGTLEDPTVTVQPWAGLTKRLRRLIGSRRPEEPPAEAGS